MIEESNLIKQGTIYILSINNKEMAAFTIHPKKYDTEQFVEKYKKEHKALTIRTSIHALQLYDNENT